MKWGRKQSSPASSRTQFSPVSWFSKFKLKGGTPETSSGHRGKLDFPTRKSSSSAGWREAVFYSVVVDDDDAFWRLSFREGTHETRRQIYPLWYDSSDEYQVPESSLRGKDCRRGLHRSIKDMVLDIEQMEENQFRENLMRENGVVRKKKPNGGGDVNHQQSRKQRHRAVRKKKAQVERGGDDVEGKSSKPAGIDILSMEMEDPDQIEEEFWDPDKEDYVFAEMDGEDSNADSARVSMSKENKKSRKKRARKSRVNPTAEGRRSHSSKIKQIRTKAYGPKTDSRIQVLGRMKNGRQKLKKETMKFNSFAVVKSSSNPQEDFRESMVEMIRHQGIKRPEELEELLACYLTLNSDGKHDLIISVFQQVWCELSEGVC